MTKFNKRTTWLFITLFVHISLLDLFFVTYNGPVFLWDKNSEMLTILTHFTIALCSVLFYLLISKLRGQYQAGQFKIGEKIWIMCSLFLVLSIGFIVF